MSLTLVTLAVVIVSAAFGRAGMWGFVTKWQDRSQPRDESEIGRSLKEQFVRHLTSWQSDAMRAVSMPLARLLSGKHGTPKRLIGSGGLSPPAAISL